MTVKPKAVIKVEQWIVRHSNKDSNWKGLEAKKMQNGKWLCEIALPEIGICVKAVSKIEKKAISSAASKAYAVIGEFLHCNMNSSATIDSIRNMGIEIGENGEFTSTQLSKKQKERIASSLSWASKPESDE